MINMLEMYTIEAENLPKKREEEHRKLLNIDIEGADSAPTK
jgi:hypothetical protein